jgi:hypothetical protein
LPTGKPPIAHGTRPSTLITCRRRGVLRANVAIFVLGWVAAAQSAHGDAADRDLSGFSAGQTFTVSIALDIPDGTQVAALEDAPPSGWVVSNISDGGTWDAQAEKVKWGPFFGGPYPTLVTYDVTPPGELTGTLCFVGSVTFDAQHQPFTGDTCLVFTMPTSSQWGCLVLALAILITATLSIRCRRPVLTAPRDAGEDATAAC